MKSIKKIISLLLCFVMVFSVFGGTAPRSVYAAGDTETQERGDIELPEVPAKERGDVETPEDTLPSQGQQGGNDPQPQDPVEYKVYARYTKNGETSPATQFMYQSFYAEVGDEVTLEVIPVDGQFTYQWSQRIWGGVFADSDPIDGWAYYKPIEGATATTLDIGAQEDLYSRQYSCTVSFPNGAHYTFNFIINTDPQLAAEVNTGTLSGGNSATGLVLYNVECDETAPMELAVSVTSGLDAGLKYSWEYYNEGGGDYTRHPLGSAAAQTIEQPKLGYYYECEITDEYHNSIAAGFKMVPVRPKDPGDSFYAYAAGTESNRGEYDVLYGDPVTFSVDAGAAAGTGTISYKWERGDRIDGETPDDWHYEYTVLEGETSKDLAVDSVTGPCVWYCCVTHSYGVSKNVMFYCNIQTSLAVNNPDQTIYVPAGSDLTLKADVVAGEVPIAAYRWSGYDSNWTALELDSSTDTLELTDIQNNSLIYCEVRDKCDASVTATFSVRTFANNGSAPGAAAIHLNAIRFFGAEDANGFEPVITLTPSPGEITPLTAAQAAELSGSAAESITVRGCSQVSAEEGTQFPLDITFSNKGLTEGQKWLLFGYDNGEWSYIGAVDQANATTELTFEKLGTAALALQDKALEPAPPEVTWTDPSYSWTWDNGLSTYKVSAYREQLEDDTEFETETVAASKTQNGNAVTYKAEFANEAFEVQYMTKDMGSSITAAGESSEGGAVELVMDKEPVAEEQKLTPALAAQLITRIVKAVADNDQEVLSGTAATVDEGALTENSSKNLEVVWEKNIKAPEGVPFPIVIDFSVPGVRDDQEVFVYHFKNGLWELVGSGKGHKVTGTFTSLSPVAIAANGAQPPAEETFTIDPDLDDYIRKAVAADYGASAALTVACGISDSSKLSVQWYKITKEQYEGTMDPPEPYMPSEIVYPQGGTAIAGATSLTYNTPPLTEKEYYYCKVVYSGQPDSPKYAVFSAYPKTGLLEYAFGTGVYDECIYVRQGSSVKVGQSFRPQHGSVEYQWRRWDDKNAINEYVMYGNMPGYEPDCTVIEGAASAAYALDNVTSAVILEELVTDSEGRSLSVFYYIGIDNGLDAKAVSDGIVFTGTSQELSSFQLRHDCYELNVAPGSTVTITADAQADSGEIGCVWYSDNNSTSPSITRQNVTSSSNAYCVITDASGNSVALDIEIIVPSTSFSIADEQDNFVYVAPGGSITLEAVPKNATGNVTYVWKNGSTTLGNERTLTLSNVTEAISYTCTAKDEANKKATVSYYIQLDSGLYVNSLVGTKLETAPKGYESSWELHVPRGSKAELKAEYGAGIGTVKECSWSESATSIASGADHSMVISQSDTADSGIIWNNVSYKFTAVDQYNSSKSILVTVIADEPEIDYVLGDVNGDSEVDANDLTALSRHVAKIEEITDESLLKAADVNSDSGVDANDLTLLSRYVAHIISSFSE